MPLSPDLFKRLSALNRRRLADDLVTGRDLADAPAPSPAARDGETAAPRANGNAAVSEDGPLALEDLIPGREREAFGGRYYLVDRPAEDFLSPVAGRDAERADLSSRYRHVVCGAGRAVEPAGLHESLRPLILTDPSAIVYLDIETCGLAGEPLFLVGLLEWDAPALRVRQFLARDYSEEGPLLADVWRALGRCECLVTYNGKTFDMPTVGARSVACGLFDLPPMPQHVDLLPEARRRWRGVLPDCRLQTVEQAICARRRRGDIPGCDIPVAYHDFVRAQQSGDARRRRRSLCRLQTILHHNALDLLTMADLVTHILSGGA
ncbi:MAG: ribonuclease H-like domain-containing protein [Planctomycetes bacterium]|nr:ribonuclease H-like domain-containing protein [Planctomycetota bacterium]